MYDVISIGSATRDVFLKMEGVETRKHPDSPTSIEQCFPLGTKIEVKEIVFATGGGGTNAAVTFGRQGFKTAYVGMIGDDFAGEEIVRELKKEKIDTRFLQRHSEGHTAYSVILVNENAERTILSYKGEGQHFDANKIPVNKFKSKWLYIDSLGGHFDLFKALVDHAVNNGMKIACNPGGKELEHGFDKLAPLLKHIDIFAVNKEEGAQLVGTKPDEVEETLKRLSQTCCGMVILTDGHNGSKVMSKDIFYSAGVPDSPVVERTGAGDAFNSGFVAEYMRQMSDPSTHSTSSLQWPEGPSGPRTAGQASSGQAIKKAIQFATANSSSVVTQVGSKAGILKKGDFGPWPLVEVEERR